MTEVTDVEIWRDGGTLEFRVLNSTADGSYRLETPVAGVPDPLFKDGVRLGFGSAEEYAVLSALQEWLAGVSTPYVIRALLELKNLGIWLNLPRRLAEVVPVYHIRRVVERLQVRCI